MQAKLAVDKAHTSGPAVAGIKIDKAKCFDRLTPQILALLMLAFGLPLSLVRFFLAIYSSSRTIADAIWKDRPVWRSRSLLFAVLGKPHRSDPICARAYITILDTIDFLVRNSPARHTWEAIYDQDAHLESSLHMQFAQACAMFDIEWKGPFHLALWGELSFSFLTLSKADVKSVLQKLAAHKMYTAAMRSKRKVASCRLL